MAWVYLLRCADGTLYCGWTVDLARIKGLTRARKLALIGR